MEINKSNGHYYDGVQQILENHAYGSQQDIDPIKHSGGIGGYDFSHGNPFYKKIDVLGNLKDHNDDVVEHKNHDQGGESHPPFVLDQLKTSAEGVHNILSLKNHHCIDWSQDHTYINTRNNAKHHTNTSKRSNDNTGAYQFPEIVSHAIRHRFQIDLVLVVDIRFDVVHHHPIEQGVIDHRSHQKQSHRHISQGGKGLQGVLCIVCPYQTGGKILDVIRIGQNHDQKGRPGNFKDQAKKWLPMSPEELKRIGDDSSQFPLFFKMYCLVHNRWFC